MNRKAAIRSVRYGVALALSSGMYLSAQASGLDESVNFDIPPEPLPSALMRFSRQAQVQLVSQEREISDIYTHGVSGQMLAYAGLERLLQGTGFQYRRVGDETVAIKSAAPAAEARKPEVAGPPAPRLARADFGAANAAPQAASQQQGAAGEAQNLGQVTVTGTRIKRSTAISSQPVLRISREAITKSGLTSVGQILESITSGHATMNGAFNFEASGAATIDLRYLGAKRALVLVNGHRWITTLSGSTDLNTIPLSLVDHIEVLQNGASALYGSDAVAGVINIITKKNFNGMEASAYLGAYRGGDGWDGKTQHYDVTLGSQGNREGWTFNASYRNNERIAASDREFSRVPVYGTGVTRGSSSTPQGRFGFVAPTTGDSSTPNVVPAPSTGLTAQQCPARNFGTADAPTYLPYCDLTLAPGADGQNPANYVPWSNEARYNWIKAAGNSLGDSLVIPIETKAIYARGHYDLTPDITFVMSGFYNQRYSQTDAAPPLLTFSGSIDADQKYNPFGFTLSPNQPIEVAPGVSRPTLSFIFRRLSEFPIRQTRRRVHTYRFSGGFQGQFTAGSTLWNWDSAFIYMTNDQESSNPAGYDVGRSDEALSTGCSSDPSCVPLNLFGGQGASGNGTITPAQVHYIAYVSQNQTHEVARLYDANISTTNLAMLPAGGLGFAAGYEYRQEVGSYLPDSHSQLGETGSRQPVAPTNGRYNVNSVYAEFNVPLLANLPGLYNLSVDVASRYSDYNTFGSTTKSRAGFKYQPVPDLAIRGTWSEAYRAPNIDELFASQSQHFPTVFDPCTDYKTSGVSGDVQARCAAAGVPESYSQANQQINSLEGGNSNLQPETATSKSFGFVYSPEWLPGFNVSADYYHINLENTIQPYGAQNVVNGCYIAGDQTDCAKIQRNVFGGVTLIQNTETNIGGTFTDGIDIGANYSWLTDFGQFRVDFQDSHVRDYEIYFPNGQGGTDTTKLVGIQRAGATLPYSVPEDKANLGLSWNSGNWGASWTIYYLSGLTEPHCSDSFDNTSLSLTNLGLCSNPNKENNALSTNYMGAVTWHNVRAHYTFASVGTTLAFGIRNLFDKRPPNQTRPIEDIAFDPTMYQFLIGRFFYASVTTKF